MFGQIGSYAIRLISTVLLARMLTPSDYGLVAMVAVVTQFIAIFSDMGLSMSTVQQDKINHQQVSNLFWINMLVTSCLGILLALFTPLIAWFYNDPRIIGITLWTSVTFPLTGLALQHYALLKRQMHFAAIARIQLVSMTISVAAALTAAFMGMGYWSLIVMSISSLVCEVPMVWTTTKWIPSWFTRNQGTRSHFAFGGYLTGSNVAGYIFRNMDRVLIGKFCSAQELGLYDRAYQLLMMPLNQFIYPLSNLAMPVLSRLQDDSGRYRKVYLDMQEKMCFAVAPVIGVILAYNDLIIKLMLGNQWLKASSIFVWLSLIGILQATLGLVGSLFISQGRVKESLWWQIATSIMATLSFAIGLPWGAKGVAISYALSGLFLRVPLYIWWAGRKGPVTSLDIALPVVSFAGYGLGLAFLFYSFRLLFNLGDNIYISLLVLTASLLISYGGYFVLPRTRVIAFELLKYHSVIFKK
jgi:O-antigen/teichoic acid export membrane protein